MKVMAKDQERNKIEDYSWEGIAEETEKVYLSLMG